MKISNQLKLKIYKIFTTLKLEKVYSFTKALQSNFRLLKYFNSPFVEPIPNYYQAAILDRFKKIEIDMLFIDHKPIQVLSSSKSQISQDLLALLVAKRIEIEINAFKKINFFVEFGACDGLSSSNTWLLEKFYSWEGLLIEPGKMWHSNLANNRNCKLDFRAINSENGSFIFSENSIEPTFSKLLETKDKQEKSGIYNYTVQAAPLTQVLDENEVPNVIDFMSIDIEGKEFEVLKSFDFNKYSVSMLTVEHNHRSDWEKQNLFIESMGFTEFKSLRKYSGGDAWFINKKFQNLFTNLI